MENYCGMCRRPVKAVKKTGAGFWIMAVFTSGLWLLTYPFKRRRYCPICKGKL